MKNEMYYYNVLPKIVNVNKKTKITIQPLESKYNFNEEIEYLIEIHGTTRNSRNYNQSPENKLCVKGSDNSLIFEYLFDKEEEYYIRIFIYNEQTEAYDRIVQLSVYALEDDLYSRRPMKGDLHIHSCRSDGKEIPPVVAANYRSAGFDFIGITDHRNYNGSVESIEAYKDMEIGIKLFNGEEVHTPENIVHIVHFGGKSSVNEIFMNDPDLFHKEVNEIIESEEIPYETDKFLYASCMWVTRKIHEAEGLSIFAHPHWTPNIYNVPDELSYALLRNGVFDVFELINGIPAHENNMQVAFYNDLREEGVKIPIVGSTDSHGTINTRPFSRKYTIVFSDDCILDSIKDGYCVAVESYIEAPNYYVHGKYRFVSYARFLIENYFSMTQQFCVEEGLLMRQYLLNIDTESVKARMSVIKDYTLNYYKKCFGK